MPAGSPHLKIEMWGTRFLLGWKVGTADSLWRLLVVPELFFCAESEAAGY
jgi:hypothetical protein